MTEVRVISPEAIAENRALLTAVFESALEHDPTAMDGAQVCQWAEDGNVLVFVADGGQIIMTMGIMDTRIGRIAEMLTLTGKDFLKKADELWPTIEQACREQGCVRVLMHGRPGWRKILKGQGFEVARTTMAKELN